MDQSFLLVANMNEAFGNGRGVLGTVNWPRLQNQCKSIAHEIKELKEGFDNKHVYKIRDAICDILVFSYGALHYLGYTAEDRMPYGGHTFGVHTPASTVVLFLNAHSMDIMDAIEYKNQVTLTFALENLIRYCQDLAKTLRQPLDEDMASVVSGVMTRFVKDDADKQATIAKHAAAGVTDVYFTGSYPTMVMRSASEQPDAPKDKFLKSASFREPTFCEARFNLAALSIQ